MEQYNYQGILQKPVGLRFHARPTAAEMTEGTDLRGKTVVVRGGYAGIGLEMVKALSEAGATW